MGGVEKTTYGELEDGRVVVLVPEVHERLEGGDSVEPGRGQRSAPACCTRQLVDEMMRKGQPRQYAHKSSCCPPPQ